MNVKGGTRVALLVHGILGIFLLAYGALYLVLRVDGTPALGIDPSRVWEIFRVILPMFVLGALIFLYIRLLIVSRGRSPVAVTRQWVAQTQWRDVLLLRLPLAIVFLLANQTIYVALKVNIPLAVPFSWDATFAAWDRALFFGVDAWHLTHGVFSTPLATAIIDGTYVAWFFVVYLGFLGFALLPSTSEVRLGFLLAFGLAWALGGSVLATGFSSAGPVYMERLFGDPTFAPLMDRLAQQADMARVSALNVQETLWQGFANPETPAIGISAFPSLHNCITVVILCAGARVSRYLGIALGIFAAAIAIGSVHLGWHYAVDTIAGLALGWVFWRMGLRLARWWLGRVLAPGDVTPPRETPSTPLA